MKKHTQYSVGLLIWLLSCYAFSSCIDTRQGMDASKKYSEQAKEAKLGTHYGVPKIENAMVLEEWILIDLNTHDFSEKRLKYWLDNGLNVDAKDQQDIYGYCTLLMHAVLAKNKPAVQYLIGKRANVNAQNYSQYTALMLAVRLALTTTTEAEERICEDIITLLLERGADPNATTTNHETAQAFIEDYPGASDEKRARLKKILDTVKKLDPMLIIDKVFWDFFGQIKDTCPFIIENMQSFLRITGIDIKARNSTGDTMLILVAQFECEGEDEYEENEEIEPLLQFIIDQGVDVNAEDNRGSTVLKLAIAQLRPGLIDFLLKNGADPIKKNSDGEDALSFAKRYQQEKLPDNERLNSIIKQLEAAVQ